MSFIATSRSILSFWLQINLILNMEPATLSRGLLKERLSLLPLTSKFGVLVDSVIHSTITRYDLFSDDYDTSEKARVPAWTDRVLWKRRKPQGILSYRKKFKAKCSSTGPVPSDWSDGDLVYYGRAELKQSDHRPVLAVLDVQAWVVNTMKREQVISDVVSSLGPSDGTVISTPCTGSTNVSLSAIGGSLEEVVGSINSMSTLLILYIYLFILIYQAR